MKRSLLRTQILLPGIALAVCSFAPPSQASSWTGTTGDWSSDLNPGWNGTGVPNAVAAVAEYSGGASATVVQNIGAGVTVGTIRSFGSGNASFTVTASNSIILNQDGGGSGFALIETSRTSNQAHRLNIAGPGSLSLADNLLVRNSGNGTGALGSIQLNANITGTGNITFDNVSNNTSAGQIYLNSSSTSDFTGNVLIRRGAVAFTDKDHFGNRATNVITLGEAGQGSSTLVSNAAISGAIVNNIVSAAGTGGTNVLGSVSAAASGTTTYAGTVLLNGDLTLTSSNISAGHVAVSGVISGVGSLVKSGTGIARLSGVNTYTGNTTVNDGTLLLASGGEQRFVIQDGGISNQLQFTGTSSLDLNGTLRLDISGLTVSSGIWNLVVDSSTTTATYGGSFGLAFVGGPTFTNVGGGLYTSGDWTFNTGNGNLSLVPEPGTAGLIALGGTAIIFFRRRRGKA